MINATFAILQIFIVSKATSVDRECNLNSVLLRDIGIFPTIIMSCQQVRQVREKCNYSECFHKNKILVGCQSTVSEYLQLVAACIFHKSNKSP